MTSADELPRGPGLVVYDTISEVEPNLLDLAGVLAVKLASLDVETTLAIIGNVNARLLTDGLADPTLHQQLERDLVHRQYLQRLARVRGDRRAQKSVIFTRRALLLIAKIALGVRRDDTSVTLDEREVGTCVLIANELLQRPKPHDDQLVVDMIANWQLFAPIEFVHLVARFRLIFSRLRNSTHPTVVNIRGLLPLDQRVFDGLTHSEFQALLATSVVIIMNAVRNRLPPALRIEPPLPSFVGDELRVRGFFALRSQPIRAWTDWRYGASWTIDDLRKLLADDLFLHDETTFRRQPFIDFGDRYLLPDYQLLTERMTFGAYWTIFDGLGPKERLSFRAAWGIAFEEYILSMFLDVYPQSGLLTNVFTPNFKFSHGEIDAVLDFADHVLVFEVKSSLLPLDVRLSRDVAKFDAWIANRLVGGEKEAGGLAQLARNTEAVRDGALGATGKTVYPVLITDEWSFQSLGVNRYFSRVFSKLLHDDARIRTLTVITTDELEKLLQCVADGLVSWRSVLERRATDNEGWLWTGQSLFAELASSGRLRDARPNDLLGREYRSFMRDLKVPETSILF